MDKRTAFLVLGIWIGFAPLLFGSVPEASVGSGSAAARFLSAGGGYALFRGFGYVLLGLLLPALLAGRPAVGAARRILFPLAALLVLGFLQLVPLPVPLVRVLAPAHAADVAALLPGRSWVPLSVEPELTRAAIVRVFLLLVAALAVLETVRTPRRALWLLAVVAGAAALDAAYGILESSVLSDSVLGFVKPGDAGAVTGTFFYRGNFAAFAAAGAGIAAAGLVAAFRARRPLIAALAAMAIPVLGAGVYLSRSRAGLLALGLAVAAGLVLRLRSRRLLMAAAVAVLAAVVGGGLLFGAVRKRFEYFRESASASFLDVRIPAWASTLDLFSGRPVLGTGLGTFRRAIHLTQSTRNPKELYFAHSDPLNLLAEGGAAGFLLGAAVALLGLAGAVRLARRDEGAAGGAGAAAAAGLVGLLAMAAVDFPLEIPATALVFAVLAFLPAALGPRPAARSAPRARRLLAGLVAIAATGLLLLSVGDDLARSREHPGARTEGEVLRAEGEAALTAGEVPAAREKLLAARARMPFDGTTRFLLAAVSLERRDFEAGRRELLCASRLARGRGELLYRIGMLAMTDRTLLDLALPALKEAGELEPKYYAAALVSIPPGFLEAITPDRAWAFARLGEFRAGSGDGEGAIEAFWRARELDPACGVEPRLAAVYRSLGREKEGRAAFAKHGAVWPEPAGGGR